MPDTFFISDTHFGHENIIRYCNRPFSSAAEMNDVMVEKWNAVVKPNDVVYHLGDVYFKMHDQVILSLLRSLNGKKRLVVGNHDFANKRMTGILLECFDKVKYWYRMPKEGIILTHVPLHSQQISEAGQFDMNVHGHIHDHDSPTDRHFNVSVERTDYAPMHIEDILSVRKNLPVYRS